MAKSPPAFQMYPADFLTATAEWTDEEVGIYARLLFNQWINGSIPADLKRVASLVSASANELHEMWPLIGEKFIDAEPGRLINPRMEKIRAEQAAFRSKQSEYGKLGAEKRWGNKDENSNPITEDGYPINNDGDPNGVANGVAIENHSSSSSVFSLQSSSSPSKDGDTVVSPVPSTPKNQPEEPTEDPPKQSSCPYQKIINAWHTTLPTMNRVIAAETLKKNMRARWREDPKRQSVEWWVWFFKNYIQTSAFLMGKKKDFQATLGWILKPTNFEKILNGHYVDRRKNPTTLEERNAQACEEFINDGV